MTIEQYYNKEKPVPTRKGDTGNTICETGQCANPVSEDYITIPVLWYTGYVRDSELLGVVIRILTDKRFKYDRDRIETLAAVLDLPYEKGGES